MADSHAETSNMTIFWWLLALTIFELVAIYFPWERHFIIMLLVALAFAKAALVAMYFMHLKFEKVSLTLIALTPLVICIFLILMLLPDMS